MDLQPLNFWLFYGHLLFVSSLGCFLRISLVNGDTLWLHIWFFLTLFAISDVLSPFRSLDSTIMVEGCQKTVDDSLTGRFPKSLWESVFLRLRPSPLSSRDLTLSDSLFPPW